MLLFSRISSTSFTDRLQEQNPAGSEQSKQPCGLPCSTHKSSPISSWSNKWMGLPLQPAQISQAGSALPGLPSPSARHNHTPGQACPADRHEHVRC